MGKILHSVILEKDYCNGCTHCLSRCPTHAIRIVNGKAEIKEERCIDCGECLKVCPFHAKGAMVSNLDVIQKYKYKVALSSISLYGQFPLEMDMNRVFNAIKALGFDEVYDTAHFADLLTLYEDGIISRNQGKRPLISTYCPVITRIIQTRFPSLIDNIMKMESPMEIAARAIRRKLIDQGIKDEEIGIVYITPCPAKITSIKNPIGIKQSNINEAIAIEEIYYKVMKIIDKVNTDEPIQRGTGRGISWGRVSGQSRAMGIDDYIAVDGIEEVIKVFEMVELGKLNEISFLEGYACINGCVGGPLNVENTFIAKNRVRKLADRYGEPFVEIDVALSKENFEWDQPIEPNAVFKLDDNFKIALQKMSKIEEYVQLLPGINCGACGAPNCRILAEDIVRGEATLDDCVLLKQNWQHKIVDKHEIDK